MARGTTSSIGDTHTAPNGYHYTRTEKGWQLTHHVIMEAKIGRPINKDTETVRFRDHDRDNLDPDNIYIEPKKTQTANRRLAVMIAQRAELDAQIKAIQAEIAAR